MVCRGCRQEEIRVAVWLFFYYNLLCPETGYRILQETR